MYELRAGDVLDLLKATPDKSVDLILGSPPYEDRREYDGIPSRVGQDWVDWMFAVVSESVRVCRGLVCYVIEGKTEDYRYSCTPDLLAADLHRAGFNLRKPPIFHRNGIFGSGGPDWWRNDYERCLCVTPPGRLPWSDNTANGHPPKYPPGGRPSYRKPDGTRATREYKPPRLANAGNVISGAVGRGHMGSDLAHLNEAPYPEWLVEPFVKCFCPLGVCTICQRGFGNECEDMLLVSERVQTTRTTDAILPEVLCQPMDGEESLDHQGIRDIYEGIQTSVLTGPSECQSPRLRDGASSDNVGDARQTPSLGRSGTPYKRKADGQPTRESSAHAKDRARPSTQEPQASSMPSMRAPLSENSLCPSCGNRLAGGLRRGICLDSFVGSGTTGAVALRLGRNFIGFDLRESQILIAKERLSAYDLM